MENHICLEKTNVTMFYWSPDRPRASKKNPNGSTHDRLTFHEVMTTPITATCTKTSDVIKEKNSM
jgi:hypothetical protein